MSLIGFLVLLIVLAVVVYAAKIFIDWMEPPSPIRQLIYLVLLVIVLVVLANAFGVSVGGLRLPSFR